MGQTENEGILVSGPDDLFKIDISRPVWLFSQTTMAVKEYNKLVDLLRSKMKDKGIVDTDKFLHVNHTICGQVSNREPHLKDFARQNEVIIFVSGKESSNGKMLYSVCKKINPDTYFVSFPDEIDRSWFVGKQSVGVCGATSTPKWLIEQIHEMISHF
jgi:4-hydroxy-3-methylbut-2-enyl diphosphate reductase